MPYLLYYLCYTHTVLDTFVVMGNVSGFDTAVRLVVDSVSFDQDAKIQVFEVVIRVVGGLLSAHLFATTPSIRPEFSLPWYDGELLALAQDLGNRLLPAFKTPTGIPFARINLRLGSLQYTRSVRDRVGQRS